MADTENAAISNAPKTIGILLIIFSSLYMIASLFNAATTLMGESFSGLIPQIAGAIDKKGDTGLDWKSLGAQLKTLYRIQGIQKLVTALISGLGLAAGIKLAQYSAQGVLLAFWWAVSALAYLVIEFIVFIFFIQPVFENLADLVAEAGEIGASISAVSSLFGSFGMVGIIASSVVMSVMPILTLVFILNERTQKACNAEGFLIRRE